MLATLPQYQSRFRRARFKRNMTELEYQLDCLYRLRDQLRDMPRDQFREYPKQTSWIKWQIEKLETDIALA